MSTASINISKLEAAIGYSEITSDDCIMIHKNTGEFAIVNSNKVSARFQQGWTECVSTATLDSLGLIGETSDDGVVESTIIAKWMREQQ